MRSTHAAARPAAAAALLLLAGPAPAAVQGEAAACAPGASGPALRLTAQGLRDARGNLRIAVYPATDAAFLAPAAYVRRLDVPVAAAGTVIVCVALPAPGPHAVALLHDRDASGKFGAFTDGVGFANNPRIGLGRPPVASATVEVAGITPIEVRLLYLQGLRPRPWPAPETR